MKILGFFIQFSMKLVPEGSVVIKSSLVQLNGLVSDRQQPITWTTPFY